MTTTAKGGDLVKQKLKTVYCILFGSILLIEVMIALWANDNFIRPYLGDVLVTVLICSFCRIWIPEEVSALPVYVWLFATAVELGQYFDIVKILGLENSKFLSVLLGRTFSMMDILCYAAGCLAFFLADRTLRNRIKNH